MPKSKRKKERNNYTRGVRAVAALRAYTVALGYLSTRDRDQAIRLIDERIAHEREELRAVNERRQKPAIVKPRIQSDADGID